jgi:hypothetical protein
MGFILRSAFWLCLILLLLPLGTAEQSPDLEPVGPVVAFMAAREAVSDMAGICERKPEVCETGRSLAHTLAGRAREGARLALAWVEDEPAGTDSAIVTGTVALPEQFPSR